MNNESRIKIIRNATLVGSVLNLLLTVAKILAGVIGKSSAMIADGVHSLSDLVTDIIVLVFIKVSGKERDKNHQYGHGKYETFATMLISFALMIVGAGIFWSGAKKVFDSINGEIIEQPGYIALYAALISIIAKEGLYWYTKIIGVKVNSQAMVANAWHHRSDAFSSIGTALGVSGAILLGEQWRVLDPIAGIIVSFFIFKVAWNIANPSIKELMESALPEETESNITEIIKNTPGVLGFHNLKTRKIGAIFAVEVHIKVDKYLTVESSHEIATQIEKSLRNKLGKQSHIGIHVEPYYGPIDVEQSLQKNIGNH
ncbi:MAG: cation diffusion facilitator family transporter [Dysgonamonadaceae bacterium]|jgi:cation diffusion facilitator family transporter|uniref:cation diffusion facilitator family transporter n=1 Tax=Gelidibacter sp. TaxID=2018083 RepID=UPI002CB18425|nr:cation diffusion facilitator family transporter [Gelidibacter sp.]MDD2551493.1 cation diffusion facilitator family transporter [Dysgonamonadaceae bacterium]MDD3355599.1 cation diffusion facilitator family transporter [Dysgonamonadaceae bacterium]MDD3726975.1 cation diffusion facilitator family transporter [Dysgonamonadaceae bacterium]MDD4245655.1 cation diffusion facilitator family transporter [Dysgonamonadaceae bacterium]MDD4604830.1 cation diffusion facilitator family transporter [Dysgona